jgi:carboxymethylenebutenolidase
VRTEKVSFKAAGGECDAYLACPAGAGPFPGVLFYMDIFGPRNYLYEMARTIAARGYCVLLPNIFYRVRKAPLLDVKFPILNEEDMPEVFKQIAPVREKWTPELAMEDVAPTLEFLVKQKSVRKAPVGVTGYCMGGALAIRAAAQMPDKFSVAASFHAGGLATDAANSPHLLLPKIKAELYVGHADNDRSMPPEQIERFEKALEQTALRYETELYKNAPHGWTMMDLPTGVPAAADRAMEKLFSLLTRV